MAYAAVVSLSQTIDIFLDYHQNSISPQLKDAITSLHKHSVFLQSFFDEFPHKTNPWEEIINEATYMAERIIELQLTDSLLESSAGSSRSKLEQMRHQHPYGFNELKRATEQIQSIVDELKGERRVDGPDDELIEIISRLREGWTETIAIYGEEGVGKTTLARSAYNDPSIAEHFDVRAWATVSSEYDRPRVIRDLLRSMNVESSSNDEDELTQTLLENVRGKRYLIVLDDIRDFRDRAKLGILPKEGNGSRILLTTRLFIGSKFVDLFHKMSFMDEDNAWNLLEEKIFKGDPCPSQLVSAGKMIARSCRWVPWLIEVVCGVLAAADPTEAAWEDISENIRFAAFDYGNRHSRILSLGYTYLPHHLRPCLLYLGICRKIHVSKLVKIWAAEGFLNETECKSVEETGEEYVQDLVRRNLVSVCSRKSNGRIKSIEIEDFFMFDLCVKQGRVDSFSFRVDSGFRSSNWLKELKSCCGRVSCRIDEFYKCPNFLKGAYGSTIRTLMLYMSKSQPGFRLSMGNVRLLRILDLSNARHYDLPKGVFELCHLRYLAFYCGFSISKAISNLVNLQTLIICPRESDSIFAEFPDGIWRMPQLRHLLVSSFKLPTHSYVTSALVNLQTLSRVVNFICSRENLKMVPNLKKLTLFYSCRDMVEDYELHSLIYLQNLETLKIEMDWSFREQLKSMRCAFPPTLHKLSLSSVRLGWDDMRTVGLLPNLQVLKLRKHACTGDTWETSEGGFSQLTYLLIDESNLENWLTQTSHFPKLRSLLLRCCLRLLEVPNDIGQVPSLELIELDGQNNSLLRSANMIQKDRHSLGDDRLQVHVV
ncbi:putative late blight resistance protein homolog R1A-10 isoform X2 [Salvia splendens]|uniref:putative late blight resistance protein homolog R1A-10 isoform X2 n=1 Tax=Salvia splendens TaxID=180675 RepID=UPI001C26587D|nr:putative late blight resistance protein homolog R1A-10 isoform X2 [Salvia splendens]